MNVDELNTTIRKLQAEDGDLVVVTSDKALPREAVIYVHDMVQSIVDALGVRAHVLVLDHGLDLKVIRTSQLEQVHSPSAAA